MKRLLILMSTVFFILFGCEKQPATKDEHQAKHVKESEQVNDFQVSITHDDELNVYAIITYVGDANEIDIYHGGSIFYFNIHQEDGDFEYIGAMNQPLFTTTLIRNEPHQVAFNHLKELHLKKGIYRIEAIADISLDPDDVVGTTIQIPVSKIIEIK